MAEQRVEYAIRWADPIFGLPDISRPFDSEDVALRKLWASAFDGVIVKRTVTATDWEPVDPTTDARAAVAGAGTEEGL